MEKRTRNTNRRRTSSRRAGYSTAYRAATGPEKALKRVLKRSPLLVLVVVVVLALAITLSEAMGGPLPTWHEVYAAAGLSHMDGLPEEAREATTKIHFIDVGQASATLIEQDDMFCLIDAGTADSAMDLTGYLRDAGVKTLDLLVLTHPHADHIGGMVRVLEEFEVKQVLLPDFKKGPQPNTYTTLRTLELIDTQGVPDVKAHKGDVYRLGRGTLTVVGDGIPSEDYNDISVVTLFEAPGMRFLSAGDAERAEWIALLEKHAIPRANLYSAAHHGSGKANHIEVLEAVRPHAVVVSCGKNNSYGHPHTSALKSFATVGAQVYRTDESGSVVAYVDRDGALKLTAKRAGDATAPERKWKTETNNAMQRAA